MSTRRRHSPKVTFIVRTSWATLSPGGPMTPRIRPRTPAELSGRRARALRRHHRRSPRPGPAALRADPSGRLPAGAVRRPAPVAPRRGRPAGARRRHPLRHAIGRSRSRDRDPPRRRPTRQRLRARVPRGDRARHRLHERGARRAPRGAGHRVQRRRRARRERGRLPPGRRPRRRAVGRGVHGALGARPCSNSVRSSATTARSRSSCGSSASRRDVARAELPRYVSTL